MTSTPHARRNVTVGGGRAVHTATVYLDAAGKVTGGYTDCGSEGRRPGSSRIRPTDSDVTCKRCAATDSIVSAPTPPAEVAEPTVNALDHLTDRQIASARHLASIRDDDSVAAYLRNLSVLTDRQVPEAVRLIRAALAEQRTIAPAPRRVVTVVVTVETDADDAQLAHGVIQGLGYTDATIVGCDWSPDADTIADAVDADRVEVLDLNPSRTEAAVAAQERANAAAYDADLFDR